MAQQESRSSQSARSSDDRTRVYRPPVLTVWGRIEDITRGSMGRSRDIVGMPYRNIE
jgi:hypothetical protein